MTRYWLNVKHIATGEIITVRSEEADRLDYAVEVLATRWSPDHVVEVVPFGSTEPVETVPCTGHRTGL